MFLPFSQRNGIMPIKDKLQLDAIDVDLQNAIWNVVTRNYIFGLPEHPFSYEDQSIEQLWDFYFKLNIDQIPNNVYDIQRYIKNRYYNMKYYQVYDFLEFIAAYPPRFMNINKYTEELNQAFEREYCGYRMVNRLITKITSENEIGSIEKSANTPFSSANEHMKVAHAHLSNRKKPDYRNSIKESISAVESICQEITDNKNATLGDTLKIIREKHQIDLPPTLRETLNKLYGYTNSEEGIRHALSEKPTITFDEAKFMLVVCSAFVNYLVSKCK